MMTAYPGRHFVFLRYTETEGTGKQQAMPSGTHFAKTADCANEHQMRTLASQAGAFYESNICKM